MPSVSIVMACYNAMPFLPDAVNSIRDQSISDWELIVINDGSTDDSPAYLHGIAQSDSRIRVFDQENQGQNVAAHRGIELARSPLIARMDADDVCESDRLQKQLSFLANHPKIGLVGGQIQRLGSRQSGLGSNFPLEHEAIERMLLQNQHSVCNPTVVFRKELYEQVGGYWDYDISEDWDLFLRIGEVSRLANMPDLLLRYRFHRKSINGRRIVQAQLFNEYAAFLATYRRSGHDEISFENFVEHHRINCWPSSWLFYSDCYSIGQYRRAVASLYGGQRVRGLLRLALSMAMSPTRTARRVGNMFFEQRAIAAKPNADVRPKSFKLPRRERAEALAD